MKKQLNNGGTATWSESFWKSIMRQAMNQWGQGLLSALLGSSATLVVPLMSTSSQHGHKRNLKSSFLPPDLYLPNTTLTHGQIHWMTRKLIECFSPQDSFSSLREMGTVQNGSIRRKIIITQSDNCSMDKREAELPMTCPSGAGPAIRTVPWGTAELQRQISSRFKWKKRLTPSFFIFLPP